MGSFLSSLFQPKTTMLETEAKKLLYNPDGNTTVDQFLFNLKSWAMHTSDDFDKALSDINVSCIMHSKVPENPEHEFLIIETLDRDKTLKRFILERMTSKTASTANFPGEDIRGTKLIPMIKDLVSSICSSDDLSSEIEALEGGSARQSIKDKTFLMSVESAKVVSKSLDNKEETLAIDRFLGETKVFDRRWHGQIVQYFKPNDLTLFQLAAIANMVNILFPNYSKLDNHCYFYAALVYAVARDIGKIRPSVNADEGGDLLYNIDSHLFDKFGRWKGLKVASVDPELVAQIVKLYKKSEADLIFSVRFIYYDIKNCI
jgi:hypothetical protein